MLLPWRSRYLGGLDGGRGRGCALVIDWGLGRNRTLSTCPVSSRAKCSLHLCHLHPQVVIPSFAGETEARLDAPVYWGWAHTSSGKGRNKGAFDEEQAGSN